GTFLWRKREVQLRPETTYAIVFAAGVSHPRAAPAMCLLRDGSIWGGRLAGGNRTAVRLAVMPERTVEIPVEGILEVQLEGSRVRWAMAWSRSRPTARWYSTAALSQETMSPARSLCRSKERKRFN